MSGITVIEHSVEKAQPLPFPPGMGGHDLLSIHDLSPKEVEFILNLGRQVKAHPGRYAHTLEGKELALLFEEPNLCTHVTFESAMTEAGGKCVAVGPQEVGLGKREAVKDVALNLPRSVDIVMARAFSHESLSELAEHASIPVINGLSDFEHPCQALGDYMTLLEHKEHLAGLTLAFVGDGNNVAHSLIYGATRLGVRIKVATPPGHEPSAAVVAEARFEGGDVYLTDDPGEAVAGADAVYTDVWTSMDQKAEAEARASVFRPYQVNAALMKNAKPDAVFMHCLPARRGQEVTDEVIDSVHSIVYDQADNRLHVEKAILLSLLS